MGLRGHLTAQDEKRLVRFSLFLLSIWLLSWTPYALGKETSSTEFQLQFCSELLYFEKNEEEGTFKASWNILIISCIDGLLDSRFKYYCFVGISIVNEFVFQTASIS
jgi:hypothetical protein